MFATSGYFKGVDCPYYLSGLCDRPYCHFRHVKKDDGRDASASHAGGSRPSSPVDPALGQCIGPTGSKPVGSGSYLTKTGPTGSLSATNIPTGTAKFVEEYSVDDAASTDGPAYEPTPKYEVGGKSKRKLSTDCLYKPGGPAVEVPEYEPNHVPGSEPDPTAEYKPGSVPKFTTAQERYIPGVQKKVSKPQAKKRRANPPGVPEVVPEYVPSSVAQYNPTPKNQLKKMKKNVDTDMEYDPVNNYVCSTNPAQEDVGEVVYVPTKRPKMDEEQDGEDNALFMDLDEFGDSDDAKFSSDEELDKSELIMDSGRYESPLEEESDDEEVSEIFSVKPFFRDTSVDKSSDSTVSSQNVNVCENELKHLVRKPVSSQKCENDKSLPENLKKQKSEQSGKSKSDGKVKDKSEKYDKSSKHSSQSSSHKSSSKDSSVKSINCPVKKDVSDSKSSKSVNGTHSSKSSKHSEHSKSKTIPSSSKSSEKKTDVSSGSASESNSSKHSEKDKSKHSENEKHRDSSNKTDKDSSKSSSADKRHKSDSHRSHSSSHSKHRSSSKDNSHRKDHHKESKDKLKESENRKSKDSHSRSRSSSHGHKSSSGSSNGHSHSSRSGSKSEKENKNKHEKSKSSSSSSTSSSSKNSKEKSVKNSKDLAHINEDLFGSESEGEAPNKSNNNSQEMTDAELARFLEDSDFESDNDTFEECLKIFNEDAPSFSKLKSEKKLQKDSSHTPNNETPVVTGKKRVARSQDSRPFKQAAPKVPVKMSPAQVMHNRLAEMQRRALEAAEARKAVAEAQAATSSSSSSTSQGKAGSKNRLAHIPRSRSTEGKSLNDREEDKRTVAITVARGQKRTAHAPTISNVKRPTIPAEFGGKVPSNIRQRYLNLIIDECLKICKTEEGAYKKGQEEETAVYKRATNKNIYLRVAVNAIKRLRVEAVQASPSPTKSSPTKIVKQSHEAVLGGKNATKTTYTLHRSGGGNKTQTDDFKGADLYQRLSKYIMTEDQLKENGYPRPSPEGGSKAVFFRDRNEKDVILKAHEKNCVRCGKRFIVFPNGSYNREEECIYHWGKAWKKRVDRALVTSYNCCGGDLEAEGCQVCKFHVYESNKAENVTGYMKTIPSSPPIDGDYGVYAMDCEMVYTKGGMELARVTVIDSDSKPVYEALVKPDFPVIDHNTRFSGLTEEDLKGVTTTLRDVQAVLLSLFTDKTILIGHSLESDLISVKLIHNTVVDTSIVFPHRLGPPYKRALRNLMVDFLKKIIQDDVGGHDSQEDALACLQLMQWKLKEDAKKEIRRI